MHRGRVILSDQMELKWLAMVLVAFLLGVCSDGCWEEERFALFQLKPFFNFLDDLGYSVEGKERSDCCEWERVECNTTTGRVIRLFLNLTETVVSRGFIYFSENTDYYRWGSGRENWYLNASLFLPFEELQSLYLSGNSIAGCVANQGFEKLSSKLDKLEILDLSNNYFNDSILISLSELSSLKFLNLAFNKFTSSDPIHGIKWLSKLNSLETLYLHENDLRNNILSHLDGFTSLKSLSLQECGLEGTVDMLKFNNLLNLKELYLSENKIESLGSLYQEKEQSKLIKLEVLGLNYNLFNNSIFSSLGVFSNLKSLNLNGNKLKGSIQIKDLNALSNLEVLTLSNNKLNEFAPSQELRLMNLKVLGLGLNRFNNSIMSSFGRLSNLKSLYLGGNNFEGSIDIRELDGLSNLEELSLGCDFEFSFSTGVDTNCSLSLQSLGFFPSLKNLFLDGLSLTGTIMTSHSRSSVRSIGEFASLKRLELHGCEINYNLTFQDWQNLTSLEDLLIEDSSLPSNFMGMLTSLKSLELWFSNINGNLSIQDPVQFKNLESLDIYGTSLDNNFLQKIGAMPSIKYLSLWECGLNGTLHTQGFCELTNLQILDLEGNNLKGNLPDCFSNLTSLESLYLNSNQFSGDVSALKSLTSLQILSLSNNYFQIPSSLGPFFNLSKLQIIEADNNTIYTESREQPLVPRFQLNEISLSCCGDAGPFPQFLYHQSDLRYVDLSNVNLKGEFPNWLLQNNTNLRSLFLANNSLLGPFELSFLSPMDLSYLDISKNSFHGNIPIEIGAKLPSLFFLNMSKNYFGGSIPASIGAMNSLYHLDMSDNKLSGRLPEHLAMGCFSLISLTLSNNRLQGQMFSSNFNLTNLKELHLDGNQFSGRIPESLSNCSYLSTLDVSNNKLVGGIPNWMENMSSLSTLDLSNNKLSGRIPKWMGNLSSLEEIVLANNLLEGSIPVEFCHLNLHLKLLDLSVNNISGHLPSCFSPLWISQVHLSRNKLEGPLTNVFRNSTILVTLDLSNNHLTGKIPTWIDKLSQLSYLLLNNNHFDGGIPVQLCKLGHLSVIDLSNNNLSGTIPPCLKITTLNEISQDYVRYVAAVAHAPSSFSIEEPIEFKSKNMSYSYKGKVLTYLSGIDLSCNKLTGEIPHEVKNFRNIYALNLSHNSLTGSIPVAFSDLKQVESLDLSYNNLSGKIPPQLVGLYALSYFSVAYNNLSGSTPKWTAQFATFGESSYMGNPLLCGAPLPNNCSTSGPSSSILPKASSGNGPIDLNVFYVCFVVSYVMVLLSIASVLYINPYWRRAWFYHIEVVSNSCYYFVEDYILPRKFHCGNM